ncbi:PhnD/SsuA/transferrin family substrate-binding protein [Chloroflexota bacterium]
MYAKRFKYRLFSVFRIFMAISFVLTTFLTSTANTTLAADGHDFLVRHDQEQIHCHGWTPGETLTLNIDEPGVPGSPDYSVTGVVWGDGSYNFELGGIYDILPGFTISVSNGSDILVHTVQDLWITFVDVDNDMVYGTTAPGSDVHFEIPAYDGNFGAYRHEIANPVTGVWVADYSVAGDEAEEGETYDIGPGDSGEGYQHQGDASTYVSFDIPNPQFQVDPSGGSFWGNEFEPDGQLTIVVNGFPVPGGPYFADGGGNFSIWIDPADLDLQAGQEVSVYDGTTTKTHTITNLLITGVDHTTDTVMGLAEPGTTVDVWEHSSGVSMQVVAGPDGFWQVDFSGQVDLQPGMDGNSSQCDADNDCTMGGWWVPNPTFAVRPDGDQVSGWDWSGDVMVTIINGPSFPATVDESGYFNLNLDGAYDIIPGKILEVTDGTNTKYHTVTNLIINDVDVVSDVVYGTADAGAQVSVWVCWEDDCANRWEMADGTGFWSADFSVAGDEGGEELTYDIQPGTWVDSGEWDGDGDNTNAGFNVPDPRFAVRSDGDNINGWDWTPNDVITVTLNGGPSYTAPTDDWGNFDLNLDGAYDIVPTTYAEVTDGVDTKDHTVTNLTIDSVDVDADTVHGWATPGAQVNIWICWENDCANRWEMADDSTGEWSTNFRIPGNEGGEELTYDIQPGTWVDSGEWDGDGDNTNAGYNVPDPRFAVQLFDAQIEGWDWPLGANVDLVVDDPGTPQNPDYTDTQTVVLADWDPNQTSLRFQIDDTFFIQPGNLITLTLSGGNTTKVHTVINLGITDVDLDGDTVEGYGLGDTQIDLWICEDWGCANRHVTSDGGNWFADFHNPGAGEDEQDTVDIVPGTRGDVSQSDEDGDSTQIWWSVSDPRIEVSYEHDWVQISDFTAGGQVTYTIFDYEGGNALFGPVTGPVDSHGNGWISSNLHNTNLVPGNYITAVNEASGEEVSILVQNVNLDYVGIDDDRAFGTAEPDSTIELNISTSHDDGFNLPVDVDGSGYWEVDLAAEGYPIDTYRYAGARIYDAEGDSIIAQNPRLHGEVRSDNMSVDNFSKNADVTMTLYDAPGGAILYEPEIVHTDGSGSAWVNLWEHGIDLQTGHYITAYDHTLDFTKALEVELFTFEEMNTAADYVRGTSYVDEWVDLHIESLFSNWGLDAQTDENENWFRSYGDENYDLTDQMWAYGWAVDDQGNWSQDHITGLPNIEASVASDWISGFNFSPNRDVNVQIYEFFGGPLLADVYTTADGNTQFYMDHGEHGIDLQPGMYLNVVDQETGKTASLELAHLTFDGVDYGLDRAWGRADEGMQVVVRADWLFDHYEITVVADQDGNWYADFAALGVDLTPDWGLRALIFDTELDATVADAPSLPEFTASLDGNWINGNNWTPDENVSIEIFDAVGGPSIFGPFDVFTDGHGNFHNDLWDDGFEFSPGDHVVVTDQGSGITKDLVVVGLSIDWVDYENDMAGGFAPPEARLNIGAGNDDWNEFDFFSEPDGSWTADFGLYDIDLIEDMRLQLRHNDEDRDATQVEWWLRNAYFNVGPESQDVWGHAFEPNSFVSITIAGEHYGDFPTDEIGDFQAYWDPPPDISAGVHIQVADSQTTKAHTVTALTVSGIDIDTNIVSGTAVPDSVVTVVVHSDGGAWRSVPVDNSGNWSVDLSIPGTEPGEEGTVDLDIGSDIDIHQCDDDNDCTFISRWIANPTLHVVPAHPEVHGHEWPWDSWVTLTITDTSGTLYDDSKFVYDDPWCGEPCFDLDGIIDVTPGMVVTMSDVDTTKVVHVTGLQVTGVDPDADTVFGTAALFTDIQVDIHEWDGVSRRVTADSSGNWVADFSIPGDEDWENNTYDLAEGTSGRAIQFEVDEWDDGTLAYWEVLAPPFYCDPGTSISGYVTEEDAVTTLEWATVHIDDFHTGEELYFVDADENGFYSCDLPDADYRVWADGGGWDGTGYSREYYQETIFEHATPVVVLDGSENPDVNFTLDTPIVVYDHFTFNINDPIMGDPAVRQAVAFGTDRERIIQETFPASPLMHTFLNPDHWAADLTTQYAFDPDQARAVLDAAGWLVNGGDGIRERNGERLRIVYFTSQADFRATISDIFFENMEDIGVAVEVNAVPWNDFENQVFNERDFGIAQFAWGFDVNDDSWPGSIFQSDIYENPGDYSNPAVDSQLEQAWGYGTRAEKLAFLHTVQQQVMGDLATLPLLMRVDAQPPEFLDASFDPNPVAVEQDVTISATFEAFHGPIVAIEYFTDVSDGWVPMDYCDGGGLIQTCTKTTTFGTGGVYSIFVRAQDELGNWSQPTLAGILAVYDPSDGFVTGGGQIIPGGKTSYDDDYLPNIDGESPAVFGFNVKYKKGSSTVPSGHILFQYRRGDLKLQSKDFDWLVITNSVWAKFKGVATIDGYEGLFPFRVDARDSDKLGGSQDDRFIIRIWAPDSDPDHDSPIYKASGDVQGQIVIHDKKDPIFMLGALFEYSAGMDLTFASSNAVQMAVQQANDAGGVLGSDVLAYYRDAGDGGSFDVTRDAALDLIEGRGVQAIIGPGFSSNTQAILEDLVVPSQLLLASPSNTNPSLADIPDNGLYFRTVASDLVRGRAAAWRAYDSGARTAVVIMREETYISEVAQEFMNVFQSYGGDIIRVVFSSEDPDETIHLAFDALDTPPDVVYVASRDRYEVINLVQHALCQTTTDGQRASESNWHFGFVDILDESFVQEVSGWYPCELDQAVVEQDLVGYEQISPLWAYDLGNDNFQNAYQAVFGDYPATFGNTAYDAAVLVMLAAEEAGTTDPTVISEHMLTVSTDGTPVSDFPTALEMVRNGEDIDWQGTYAGQLNGLTYDINHDFEPDGETINPVLVLQIQGDGSVAFVDTVSQAVLQPEDAQISMQIAMNSGFEDPGDFIQAAHQMGAMLEEFSGQSVSTYVPLGDRVNSQETIIDALQQGTADLAALTWLTHMVAYETTGAEIGLTNIRFGQPYFNSQVWTRLGTGFTEITDLAGVPICYGDPSSASSYVIPSLMLAAEGLDPFESANIFGSHDGVIEALYHHQCDGGASFFDARDMLLDTYDDVKEVVLPLVQSPQIPNEGFSFGAHVPDQQRDAVTTALLEITGTPDGFELLQIITGGSEGLFETDQSMYNGLETLFAAAGMTSQEVWENYYSP